MNESSQSLASLLPQQAPLRETLRQADVFIADLENAGYTQQAKDYRDSIIYQVQLGRDAKSAEELPTIAQNINGIVSGLRGISKSSLSAPPKQEPIVSQEDQAAKAAMIQAAQAGFASRIEEATNRGVNVTPEVVSSISSLINTGKTTEAANLQDQIFGKVETSTERQARIKGQKETKVEQEQALRSATDAAEGIRTINKLTSSEGFTGVFGAGIGLKYFPTETRAAENFRKKIVALATTDTMRKFQGLGQMSDKEFTVAQDSATLLSDPLIPEDRAAEELNKLRRYFATSIRRAENLGRIPEGSSEKMISEAMSELNKNGGEKNQEQSATDQLRSRLKK